MKPVKCLDQVVTDQYAVYHGDSCEMLKAIPDNSIGFSVFSPPFASLYTYSDSTRDLGNCRDDAEFFAHFQWLAPELFRVLKPGRLVSFHCMDMPTSKERDGFIGLRDFRGDLIRAFQKAGWIFHSSVCIWKDPVTAMQRTKALGLLHKTIMKDSAMSRQGIPDYLVTMRKPGRNEDAISGPLIEYVGTDAGFLTGDEYRDSINIWQRYASPVWMDIDPSDTLQRESARAEEDERHICPLQLQVIHRAIDLWSNPGDTVLTPFGGIGSEGYEAVKMGRKAIVCELKKSYFDQAVLNMESASKHTTGDLFAEVAMP
jgi:DNA modification methylase